MSFSRCWVLLSVGASAMLACSSASVYAPGAPLTGVWGGRSVSLALTASSGTVEYDCAHGRINQALLPNERGAVRALGVHVRERGGPVREGEAEDSLPAIYIGSVTRDQLTLRVVVGPDTLGPFVAGRGATPQLFKCL